MLGWQNVLRQLFFKHDVNIFWEITWQDEQVVRLMFASPEFNFTIITGPNMGGKSIYIKQIAIMQIMAQLGCYLPATNAVLRLCDRIFSRIGFNDSVELNASSFVIEMKETQHILKGLTSTSLVIIDELCRGTCSEEGTSLAWAICEELIHSSAFTFFTTHFLYLTRLQDLYCNVVNRHTMVTEEVVGTDNPQIRLIYQHKIETGVTKIENYGLALAAMTNMPEETVNLARELVELIDEPQTTQVTVNNEQNDDEILYKLKADIEQQKRKHPNLKNKVTEMLRKFRMDYPQLIERIKSQKNLRNKTNEFALELSSDKSVHRNHISSKETELNIEDRNSINSETLIQETTTSNDNEVVHRNETNITALTTDNFEGDDLQDGEDGKEDNYTSVKLSTELLNTVPGQREQIDRERTLYNEDDIAQTPILANYNYLTYSNKDDGVLSVTRRDAIKYDSADDLCNSSIDSNVIDDELDTTIDSLIDLKDKANMEIEKSVENNPDELTQVIEKCYMSSSLSSENNSIMSTDEELLQETIKEIHNDLENFIME